MEKPSYLSKYNFKWEQIDALLGGQSALDAKYFVGTFPDEEHVLNFLQGYGIDPDDPISTAELFGNFQEALQFIRRYFLIEGNPEGLDLKVPSFLYAITDIKELYSLASFESSNEEERLWSDVILRVMHTILHVDKDIRASYFAEIQTQIFDRFYRYIYRDKDNNLFLGVRDTEEQIPLVDFETKAKKTRDSAIIKLLHKEENVAEELFDRVGVRFITDTCFDALRVVKFLLDHSIAIPHNIKPSRSLNSIVDVEKFRKKYDGLVNMSLRNNLSEERFFQAMEREVIDCMPDIEHVRNIHTYRGYKSIQFTGRHLIKYTNPFFHEFNRLRQMVKETGKEDELTKRIQSMDISLIAKDIRFFYPFEVQIVDKKGHQENTEGEASYTAYKKSQLESAKLRVFGPLLEYQKEHELTL